MRKSIASFLTLSTSATQKHKSMHRNQHANETERKVLNLRLMLKKCNLIFLYPDILNTIWTVQIIFTHISGKIPQLDNDTLSFLCHLTRNSLLINNVPKYQLLKHSLQFLNLCNDGISLNFLQHQNKRKIFHILFQDYS